MLLSWLLDGDLQPQLQGVGVGKTILYHIACFCIFGAHIHIYIYTT